MTESEQRVSMVREITDDEVSFYEEHGWVKLDGLISRDLAAQLLEAAKELMERSRLGWESAGDAGGAYRDFGDWTALFHPLWFQARGIRIEPFYSFAFGKEVGRAVHRLMNRKRLTDDEIGVRYCYDALMCQPPHEEPRDHRYHQDQTFGTDRVGGFNLWIALDEVTPDQGAMRFLSGSHREGPLGDPVLEVLDRYPKLKDIYEWSPPLHYQPGDATVHHGFTIHGTPENRTDKPRWSYVPTYLPSDNLVSSAGDQDEAGIDEQRPIIYP